VGARREERREVALGIAERIRTRDADNVEAVRAGDVAKGRLETAGVV